MLKAFFHTVVYEPLYNGLIFLIDIVPQHNAGLAVIILTILVRVILFPSSRKAIRSQMKMKEIQGEVDAISKKYKDDKQERAKQTMALYKEKKINPLAPIVPLLFQLPIIFSLYLIFAQSGLPKVNSDFLYSFVQLPNMVNTNFFNLFDITQKNLYVALLAGITQFIQASVYVKLTSPSKDSPKEERGSRPSFQADFQKSMNFQMKYLFPFLVTWFAYSLSGAIALYWTTSNIFSIMQELITRREKSGPRETHKK